MSPEENKAVIRRVIEEMLNQGNLSITDEVFSLLFVDRSSADQPPGLEGIKGFVSQIRTGFPDLHVKIGHLIAEGDYVIVRTIWSGTHEGVYGGIPPTGKRVNRTLIHIFRLQNGKIIEEWNEGPGLL